MAPGRPKARLRQSTWAGYDRNVRLHIVPASDGVRSRHLRPDHVERLYAALSASGNHVRSGGLDGTPQSPDAGPSITDADEHRRWR